MRRLIHSRTVQAPSAQGSKDTGQLSSRAAWSPPALGAALCPPLSNSTTWPGGGPHPKGEPGTQEWPTSHLVPWEGSAARDLMQQGKALSQKHRKKSPEKSWPGRGEMQGMGLVFSEAVTGRTGLG